MEWTGNLLDHLHLTNDNTKVHVLFTAHPSGMETTQVRTICTSQKPFPAPTVNIGNEGQQPCNLTAEALRTLALLLPADPQTKKWPLKLLGADQSMLRFERLNSDVRQIEQFHYRWDHIAMLKQVFGGAQPKILSQGWHDRRSGILVLTLTVFFFFFLAWYKASRARGRTGSSPSAVLQWTAQHDPAPFLSRKSSVAFRLGTVGA